MSLSDLWWTLSQINLRAVLDILLVALIFWGILRLVQGTQAVQLLRGVILVALAVVILTSFLHLTAFSFLMSNTLPALLFAIPVIFQPELRRALERLGRAGAFPNRQATEPIAKQVIAAVSRAAALLSDRRHGALIVLERETGLQEYVDTGVQIDSLVTPELLLTIFFPNTALHDGAVILQADRVVAAGCVLPLSTGASMDYLLGTRHRAAIGLTEQTDAVVVVVSEETGIISVAYNGRIIRRLDENRLSKVLEAIYITGTLQVTWRRRVARRVRATWRQFKDQARHLVQQIPGINRHPS